MTGKIVGLRAYRNWKAWEAPVTPQPDRQTDREKYDAVLALQMADADRRWVESNILHFPECRS